MAPELKEVRMYRQQSKPHSQTEEGEARRLKGRHRVPKWQEEPDRKRWADGIPGRAKTLASKGVTQVLGRKLKRLCWEEMGGKGHSY